MRLPECCGFVDERLVGGSLNERQDLYAKDPAWQPSRRISSAAMGRIRSDSAQKLVSTRLQMSVITGHEKRDVETS